MDRRDIIKGLMAVTAAGGLGACGSERREATRRAPDPEANYSLRYGSADGFLSARELTLLAAVAQTIIPQTDTAGAVEAGVPDTLQALLSDWADDAMRGSWRRTLRSLEYELDEAVGGRFASASQDAREAALAPLDAAVFAGERDELSAYKDLKFTIATAYYMSEPGATEELRYEALPGRWEGCIPLEEVGRTWAT